jgi:oligo-1,6-glucosidase
MKKAWWKEAVVYQVYPRSFYDSNGDGIGDLRGVIQKLDYLKNLGIDVIWFNPIYKSPNADNGYDISDYCDIMDDFGSMKDFDELLEEAHKRGIKIILDLVVNHTSDEHPWFIESRSSKDNPYRDYYVWRKGRDGAPPNNWVSAFSGSAWQYEEKTDEYYLHIFAVKQPDLNWENEAVRKNVYEMMRWWLDKGIDGFRMDVVNYLSKIQDFPDDNLPLNGQRRIGSRYYLNGPRIHEFLKEMNKEVLRKYDIMTVGEGPIIPADMAGLYVDDDRDELNMVFHFYLMDMETGPGGKFDIKPWTLKQFKDIMWEWYDKLKEKGWNSLYLNNHDQPRMVSRFGNDKKYRVESAKMLATLLHTWVGTPYIYQGEEIGMTNVKFENIEEYNDIETLNYYKEKISEGISHEKLMDIFYKKSRDNARTPMQWDSSANAGFTTGKPWLRLNPNYTEINVENALKDPNSIFYYYKKLLQLRKENDIIIYGDCTMLCREDENIFAYVRTLGEEKLLVVLNFFAKETDFNFSLKINYSSCELMISNYEVSDTYINLIHLRPYEARVYKLK